MPGPDGPDGGNGEHGDPGLDALTHPQLYQSSRPCRLCPPGRSRRQLGLAKEGESAQVELGPQGRWGSGAPSDSALDRPAPVGWAQGEGGTGSEGGLRSLGPEPGPHDGAQGDGGAAGFPRTPRLPRGRREGCHERPWTQGKPFHPIIFSADDGYETIGGCQRGAWLRGSKR